MRTKEILAKADTNFNGSIDNCLKKESLCGTLTKVAKIGFTMLGVTYFMYLGACDTSKNEFCVLRDSIDITNNLELIASIFR